MNVLCLNDQGLSRAMRFVCLPKAPFVSAQVLTIFGGLTVN